MPLFKIDSQQSGLSPIQPSTFAAVNMRERQDLQTLLRDNPSAISSGLLIIAEEFSSWQESLRRVDLLALDRDANLVVIELKRNEEGSHMELQAIRYAAMLSAMDFEAVITAYEHFLSKPENAAKHKITPAEARKHILEFLDADSADEITIGSNPRILLIAPGFSKEITTTVLRLNDRGLDIRCLEVKPYELGKELYLDIEQVIPLPSANTFIVQSREKAIKAERQASRTRRERSVPLLVAHGVLQAGTRLHLVKMPRQGLNITDEKANFATFTDTQDAKWDYDGKIYSLSRLCREICEQFGGDVGSGAFAGPDHWAIEGQTTTLTDLVRTLKRREEK